MWTASWWDWHAAEEWWGAHGWSAAAWGEEHDDGVGFDYVEDGLLFRQCRHGQAEVVGARIVEPSGAVAMLVVDASNCMSLALDRRVVLPDVVALRFRGGELCAEAPEGKRVLHMPLGQESLAERAVLLLDLAQERRLRSLPCECPRAGLRPALALATEADCAQAACGSVAYSGEDAALSFNGVDACLRVPRPVEDDFTIAFEFRTRSGGGRPSCHWFGGSGLVDTESSSVAAAVVRRPVEASDFGVSVADGRVMFGVGRPDATVASGRRYNDGQWHAVVARRHRASGVLQLEVDGILEDSKIGSTQSLDASPFLDIGRNARGKNYFRGELRHVFVLREVLEDMDDILEPRPGAVRAAPSLALSSLSAFWHRATAAGFRMLLIGGWALDACLGRQTRAHGDVDLCVAARDRERFELWLAGPCGCTRVERHSAPDGSSKTAFTLPCGGQGEAMCLREVGDRLILEGRMWRCEAPWPRRDGGGLVLDTRSIDGRRFPIGSVELVVKMQRTWSYRAEDAGGIGALGRECDIETLKRIECAAKCLGSAGMCRRFRCASGGQDARDATCD